VSQGLLLGASAEAVTVRDTGELPRLAVSGSHSGARYARERAMLRAQA
jgi:hypothetical protein